MVQQTPGVYIIEKNAFPNSVVEVATAVPVFIGHTKQATYDNRDLSNKPIRVTSFSEFELYFGGGYFASFVLKSEAEAETDKESRLVESIPIQLWDKTTQYLVPTGKLFYLYNSIRLFYQNGGATCYIISIGSYQSGDSTKDDFVKAIDALVYESEPTMIVCPDALRLDEPDYYTVATTMLAHCATYLNRIALIDVYYGAVQSRGTLRKR
ncbi:hypothetical protein [Spirosoma flavum]|uniref:Uncharacterized protein n=1 Tax=Spirosoma flavum TaxID=2048557 RepID=A0ABW6AKC1_9BACT